MRDFFSRSLLRTPNHRRWIRRQTEDYFVRMGRRSGRQTARHRREGLRLRSGDRVWYPWARAGVLLMLILPLAGCVELLIGVGGLLASGVGIYQRVEDRNVQKDQNAEIKALRQSVEQHQAEVKRLNERLLDLQHHQKEGSQEGEK